MSERFVFMPADGSGRDRRFAALDGLAIDIAQRRRGRHVRITRAPAPHDDISGWAFSVCLQDGQLLGHVYDLDRAEPSLRLMQRLMIAIVRVPPLFQSSPTFRSRDLAA